MKGEKAEERRHMAPQADGHGGRTHTQALPLWAALYFFYINAVVCVVASHDIEPDHHTYFGDVSFPLLPILISF